MQPTFTDNQHFNYLKDRVDIIDTILRSAYAMDLHDWSLLRSCLDDEVFVDYSALRNQPAQLMSADEFVAKRAKDLSHLKLQHISTNHLATIEENKAKCTCCFLIHRLEPITCATFDTAGHYAYELVRKKTVWYIKEIIQTVLWNRGDSSIHGALRDKK